MKTQRQIPLWIIACILMLLPGILLSQNNPAQNEAREAIAAMRVRYEMIVSDMREKLAIPNNKKSDEPIAENTFTETTEDTESNIEGNASLFEWPVEGDFNISSAFGYRIDPFTKKKAFHKGIDIPLPSGTSIYPAAEGKVCRQGFNSLLGNYIVIDHGSYESIYGHLSRRSVANGTKVNKNTVIGRSGNTGRSTGPHLHFQINDKKSSKAINPETLIN